MQKPLQKQWENLWKEQAVCNKSFSLLLLQTNTRMKDSKSIKRAEPVTMTLRTKLELRKKFSRLCSNWSAELTWTVYIAVTVRSQISCIHWTQPTCRSFFSQNELNTKSKKKHVSILLLCSDSEKAIKWKQNRWKLSWWTSIQLKNIYFAVETQHYSKRNDLITEFKVKINATQWIQVQPIWHRHTSWNLTASHSLFTHSWYPFICSVRTHWQTESSGPSKDIDVSSMWPDQSCYKRLF